jgi:hypothetical protein
VSPRCVRRARRFWCSSQVGVTRPVGSFRFGPGAAASPPSANIENRDIVCQKFHHQNSSRGRYFPTEDNFSIWQRALPPFLPFRVQRARRPIRHGRCTCSLAFPPAARPISSRA